MSDQAQDQEPIPQAPPSEAMMVLLRVARANEELARANALLAAATKRAVDAEVAVDMAAFRLGAQAALEQRAKAEQPPSQGVPDDPDAE